MRRYCFIFVKEDYILSRQLLDVVFHFTDILVSVDTTSVSCDKKEDDLYTIGDVFRYLQCSNEHASIIDCPNGTVFDSIQKCCIYLTEDNIGKFLRVTFCKTDTPEIHDPLDPRGNSLTFGTGVLMSNNFLRPQIIRPAFLKTPNNQLSSSEIISIPRKWLG